MDSINMDSVKISGVTQIAGGKYKDIFVKGICTCAENLEVGKVTVGGILKTSGALEADTIECSGIIEIKSSVRAKEIKLEGIISGATKVEANNINGKGFINSNGEISADIIDIEGILEAKEIVGDNITIKPYGEDILSKMFKKFSKLEFIEATTIHLVRTYAKSVSGKDITIGPKCKIENIDCNGTLSIDNTATVKNITGDYILK
ncbi:MAG: hypothetical protein FWF46_06930 [Oscillospiraceae bacterium]|nr:hypothetical protein [Oscillospiraceae bacterium]